MASISSPRRCCDSTASVWWEEEVRHGQKQGSHGCFNATLGFFCFSLLFSSPPPPLDRAHPRHLVHQLLLPLCQLLLQLLHLLLQHHNLAPAGLLSSF